jgi:hypothetical protein
MFWGKEKTAKCQEIIYGPPDSPNTYVNRLENLITSSSQAHLYWNDGVFALKHIRGGSRTSEMVLELHWLAKHPELERSVCIDQAVEDISIQRPDGPNGLFNCETEQVVRSGQQVTLTTPDAEKYPLPDERLVQLQWFLARVLRMSAGEDEVMEYDDDIFMVSPLASSLASPAASPVASPVRCEDSEWRDGAVLGGREWARGGSAAAAGAQGGCRHED